MTDHAYPAPCTRQTLADLDPESATTDRLIAMARSHCEGLDYPTPEQLLANLPTVLRALCDVLLAGEITALDAAYRLASIVDVVDGTIDPPGAPSVRH
jgi:hypothetical protein